MIFVGNDIVNLAHESNSGVRLTDRYLDKCYTLTEQKAIRTAENSVCTLWKLWSCKEAAYKVLKKMGVVSRFAPKKLEVVSTTNSNHDDSRVIYNEVTVYIRSVGNDSGVSSTASNNASALDWIHCAQSVSTNDDSLEVRALLIKMLNDEIDSKELFEVRKDQSNIPRLYSNSEPVSTIDISLSHDYGLVSAAYLFPGNIV